MAMTGCADESPEDGEIEKTDVNVDDKTQECNSQSVDASGGGTPEVTPPVGAGLLFGLGGLLVGGPLFALFSGAGAAYAAKNDQGPVGDAARSSGDVAIEAGKRMGDIAKEANEELGVLEKIQNAISCGWTRCQQFDEKHGATEKVRGAANGVVQKAAEFEERHHVAEKTKEKVNGAVQKTREFEQEHHVGENILQGIQNGVSFLRDKLREVTSGGCDGNKQS